MVDKVKNGDKITVGTKKDRLTIFKIPGYVEKPSRYNNDLLGKPK